MKSSGEVDPESVGEAFPTLVSLLKTKSSAFANNISKQVNESLGWRSAKVTEQRGLCNVLRTCRSLSVNIHVYNIYSCIHACMQSPLGVHIHRRCRWCPGASERSPARPPRVSSTATATAAAAAAAAAATAAASARKEDHSTSKVHKFTSRCTHITVKLGPPKLILMKSSMYIHVRVHCSNAIQLWTHRSHLNGHLLWILHHIQNSSEAPPCCYQHQQEHTQEHLWLHCRQHWTVRKVEEPGPDW